MTTHFPEHDDETPIPVDPATSLDETADASATEKSSGTEPAEDKIAAEDTTPVARKKRAPRSASSGQPRRRRPREDSIIELRVPTRGEESVKPLIEAELGPAGDALARDELVAQGFTTDEAARIVDLSSRLGTSREARDAEASLRRLRFTRWLVERGVLDEFSA